MDVQRIPFIDVLPDSFFAIPQTVYKNLPFSPEEDHVYVQKLFDLEKANNDIIIYTDHKKIRLVGIFPFDCREAQFGFWESTNDEALNDAAFALLQKDVIDKGKTSLTGPINFNTFNPYRIRIGEAPSWSQFDKEPVNPDYYSSLLMQQDFTIKSRFESRLIKKENIPEIYLNKGKFLNELNDIPFEFIPLNPENWSIYEDEIYHLVHEVFGANPAYKAIPKDQFCMMYNREYARKLCPYTSVLFREKSTMKLVAMSFCHPDYKSLSLSPNESPDFQRDHPKLEKRVMLAKTVGVHPDYRKQGLMTYLGAYGMVHLRKLYEETLFCLMREDNFSLHFSKDFEYEVARYALYEKSFSK